MITYNITDLVENIIYKRNYNEFKVKDKQLYYFANNEWRLCGDSYNDVIKWDFKEGRFNAKEKDEYFYPSFITKEGFHSNIYLSNEEDQRIIDAVGIYRTKEQAQEVARLLGWMK